MVRIYGVSAEKIDSIRSLASEVFQIDISKGLYSVQLSDDVHVYGDVTFSDGKKTVTLEMSDFERIVIS